MTLAEMLREFPRTQVSLRQGHTKEFVPKPKNIKKGICLFFTFQAGPDQVVLVEFIKDRPGWDWPSSTHHDWTGHP